MTTFSQRYSSSDNSTAGAFVFHTDSTGNDVPISKVVFGADAANPTVVTASVGLPITILAGSAAIGKLTSNSGVTIGAVEIASAQSIAATQSGSWTVGVSGTVAVSAASLPLPSGASTAAKQPALGTAGTASSDVLTVQGIASMTAIKTDGSGVTQPVSGTLGATQSGTWTVQPGNTANTTAWLVTGTGGTFPATQYGTWSVRSQDGSGNSLTSAVRGAERALSVQLVDGSGNQVTSFGGGTQYAEDAGHSTGDTGTMSLAVRNDSDTSLCGTTLDYTPLQVDSNGYLKVNIKAGAGSGGTASTDDAAFTAAAGSGTPMMGFVTADSVDSGDVGVVGMLANRQLKVTLYDSGGAELSVGGGTQYTEGATDATITGTALLWEDAADTLVVASAAKPLPVSLASVPSHAVTNAGTFAVQASQSGTWNIGTVTTITNSVAVTDNGGSLTVDAPVGTPVFVRLSDGASAITTLPVSLASVPSHAVTNAGTFAVQESGTPTIVGTVAHDSADSGNPVKIGAKATTSLSGLTLVANADRTDVFAGVDGVQITRPHCNLEDIVSGNASNTDGTSTQCIAAQAAGIKTYLTTIILTNTSSSNIYVEIKDGTTVKLTIPVPANGGAICNLPVPLGGTAATAWNFDPSAATTTVYCSLVGFKSKV